MQMPGYRRLGISFLGTILSVGVTFAQGGAPAVLEVKANIIQVRIGHTSGMCGGPMYCSSLTRVEPTLVVSELRDSPNKREFPDIRARRAITKKEWQNLLQAVELTALATAPAGVCLAHIDLPCSWVEVEFADATKINLFYDEMHPPAPIAALLRQIPTAPLKIK